MIASPYKHERYPSDGRKIIDSTLSLLSHVCLFEVIRSHLELQSGVLIISLDVDVGDHVLGIINQGRNDHNVNDHLTEYNVGMIEELAVPLLVDLFEEYEIPATIGLRGQLLDVKSSVIEYFMKSPVKFDLAAHSYYHKKFLMMPREEAEEELRKTSESMIRFGIKPRSFIFPRNEIGYLDLLEKYDYLCYRGKGGNIRDGCHVSKVGNLYNIHPSLCIDKFAKVNILKKILDICIGRKLLLHIWFHPWNFGYDEVGLNSNVRKILLPFFHYAQKKSKEGLLDFETMFSMAKRVQLIENK